MFVRKLSLLFICLSGIAGGSAFGQSEARIRVVIPSIDQAEDDLKWMIELSPDTATLKKQWKRLKEDILDAFTQGVDLKQAGFRSISFFARMNCRERCEFRSRDSKFVRQERWIHWRASRRNGIQGQTSLTPKGNTSLFEISEPKKIHSS